MSKVIINKSYFIGEIYIAHATPTITDDTTEVGATLNTFISEKVEDCLMKSLGKYSLTFIDGLDDSEEKGVKNEAVDGPIDFLLNGHEFQDSKGIDRRWKGIRFKSLLGDEPKYNRSLLAYYVYYMYEQDKYISNTLVGHSKPKAKHAAVVDPSDKAIRAWRNFYKLVVGETRKPVIHETYKGIGVDYFNKSNFDLSMYEFIREMNKLDSDNYPDFQEYRWENNNQFQI